jgi:type II secretory pathway component PulM
MALYGFGFLIGIALTVIFWFLFVAPMERRMHQRKMDLMQKKLARNEERLRKLRTGENTDNNDSRDKDAFDRVE